MVTDTIDGKLKWQHLKDLHQDNLINFIKETCAAYYNIDMIYLELPMRKRNVITFRHTVYFFIKRYIYDMSFASIGQLFAKQNHATVLYAIKNITNLSEFDRKIKNDINHMDAKIKVYAESLGFDCKSNGMFIDFSHLNLITVSKDKHIAVTGMDARDIKKIVKLFSAKEPVEYNKTGLYLVAKKTVEESENTL